MPRATVQAAPPCPWGPAGILHPQIVGDAALEAVPDTIQHPTRGALSLSYRFMALESHRGKTARRIKTFKTRPEA